MQNNRSLKRQFFSFLLPSVASLVSLSLYILADTFFISVGVGSTGLAALNIAIPAYSVINAMGLMIGIGGGVVFSIARGTGDYARADRVFHTALWLAFGVGLAITVVGNLFSRELALLLGASPLSVDYSATYIRTMCSFGVFFLMNNTLVALVRNDNNPRLSMTSMVANSVSNVVFDAIFILQFGWGMWGAAFATGLSPIIGLCVLSSHFWRRKSGVMLRRQLPDLRMVGSILRGGVSNFIIEICNGVVILLFNYTLMGLAGDTGVAAYGIVANVALVVGYVFIGIGQGMQPIISLRHGEGKPEDCRQVLRMGLVIAMLFGAACFVAGLLFSPQLTAMFNSEGNARLAEITIPAIRIYFSAFLCMGIGICATSYFQSTMQARSASAISLLRGFVLVVAGVLLFPALWGVTGVWMIVPAAELLTALLCVPILARRGAGKAAARIRPDPETQT